MAQFKKTPNADSAPGLFDAFTAEAFGQVAMSYWPLILGGPPLLALIFAGRDRLAIRVGIAVALLQGLVLYG